MRIGLSLAATEPRYNLLAQNVQALFADGSQGWFYDNQDPSTLFQDSAGTTPVTAVEQSVGLQLDKSKGLVLGTELVVNGDFSSASGWTGVGNSFSIANGVATLTRTTVFTYYQSTAFAVTAGKWYWITGSWLRSSGTGQASVQVRDNVGGAIRLQQDASPGTSFQPFQYAWLATATENVYVIVGVVNAAASVHVDLVSLRELPGNHRYQTTSGSRPVWSKRVNRLTKTEQFDDASGWTKIRSSISANATTAPNGTLTADKLIEDTSTNSHLVLASAVVSAVSNTYSVYAKAAERSRIQLSTGLGGGFTTFDLANGTIAGGSGQITSAGDGWYQCSITYTPSGTSETVYIWLVASGTSNNYQGNGTSGAFIWGADLRATNQATGLLPLYQRVNTATDYDTNGFPGYLKADGTDDFLQTNSIDFSAGPTNPPLSADKLTSTWILSSGATESPTGTFNFPSSGSSIRQDGVLTSGRSYIVSFTATGSGNLNVHVGDPAAGSSDTTISSSGTYRFCLVCDGVDNDFQLRSAGTGGFVGTVTNLSVKEITNANLGADKVTLCAGVRKLSDAARGVVTELGPGTSAGFSLFAPNITTVTFAFRSWGSSAGATAETSATFAAPITGVLTGIGEIGTDTSILRINAVQQATSATDQGTGNYPSNLVSFFRRNGLSSAFNGEEYANIAVGKLLTADQLTALETYVNGATRAY